MADEDLDDIETEKIRESREFGNGPSVDEMVQSRLKSLQSRIRDLFQEQADMPLKMTPPALDEEPEEGDSEDEHLNPMTAFDSAAMSMVKSTIHKRLFSIHRGEASAKVAARNIISQSAFRHSHDILLLALEMIHQSSRKFRYQPTRDITTITHKKEKFLFQKDFY